MDIFRVIYVGPPQENLDDVNKGYADDLNINSLNKGGDTMVGELNMGSYKIVNLYWSPRFKGYQFQDPNNF